jgi:hypothetical protein
MRILCLGNNTEDTDVKVKQLALENNFECHGLLSQFDGSMIKISKDGWYHSSVYDIEYGNLLNLAEQFDSVIMLDQPKEQYSHPNAFYLTVKLIKNLSNGKFLDETYREQIDFFESLVATNKSFCIFPFIELLTNHRSDGYTTVCCRSSAPITHISKIKNWATDTNYVEIRKKMLAGERLPNHCQACYTLEEKNVQSARQQETVEWANRLNLTSVEDLQKIKSPSYYEIRPSNKCNLQCRMCGPNSSHLIGKEYKKLGLISKIPTDERTDFDIVDFTNLKKLYVAGGEPTAMPKFYQFLDRCIAEQKVDFEFLINTNGTKLSNKFKAQLKHFKNFTFILSLDGHGSLNHYIRWPSDWNTIIANMHYLKSNGHAVVPNVTVSIYNVLGLYNLLEFFDKEFPGTLVHCQVCVSNDDKLSPFIFPHYKLALEKLLPIQNLRCYANDHLLKSFIDGLIAHYQSGPVPDVDKLRLFFEFNDKLDQSRNLRLEDYIPELYATRELLT